MITSKNPYTGEVIEEFKEYTKEEINNAIQSHESYFMNEVLGVKLALGDSTFTYNNSVKINGQLTTIGIALAN